MSESSYPSQKCNHCFEERTCKQLEGYDLINGRIMVIQLKTAQEPLFVFRIYTPDSSYSQDEKDELFSLLQKQ